MLFPFQQVPIIFYHIISGQIVTTPLCGSLILLLYVVTEHLLTVIFVIMQSNHFNCVYFSVPDWPMLTAIFGVHVRSASSRWQTKKRYICASIKHKMVEGNDLNWLKNVLACFLPPLNHEIGIIAQNRIRIGIDSLAIRTITRFSILNRISTIFWINIINRTRIIIRYVPTNVCQLSGTAC